MTAHNNNFRIGNIEISQMVLTPRLSWYNAAVLIFGYIALDWVSYIHPMYGLNITPWGPAPALGLIFLLRYGRKAALPLGLAILIADAWVRDLPASLPIWIAVSVLLTLGYWAIAECLRRRLAGGGIFLDRRGLLDWIAIVATGTLLNSAIFVSALSIAGLIPLSGWHEALIRYWVGDGVGILVSMPILWMLLDERGRAQIRVAFSNWQIIPYLLFIAACLWIAFGIGAEANYKYFYILFLPIVWAAARHGLTGAVVGATLIQIGIIYCVQLLDFPVVTILEIQTLTVVLALLGLFIGVVVDEKQRVSEELRHTLRLAAAGEMAGALAHEINQPLTALSAYGAACEELLARNDTGEKLRDTIRRIVAESHRAAEVVRRLRDFFRTGATQLEHVRLNDLVTAATKPFTDKAEKQGIELIVDTIPECTLLADRLQMEIVLRNLLSNAFDAVAEQPSNQRRIRLSAQLESATRVCISVEDSGNGLSGTMALQIFEIFHTSKTSGLGLGLTISRAIVEAHGGNLWAEVEDHGVFKLSLPIERNDNAT